MRAQRGNPQSTQKTTNFYKKIPFSFPKIEHLKWLHKKCKPLYDYCSFVDRIKNNIKNNMEKEAAIDEAIEWAIKENLLEGYFEEQRAEVKAVILTDFDQEQYDRNRRREGYEEGIAKGAQQKAV